MITRKSISRSAVAAYVFASVVALSVGYFIAGIPIQLTDSLENLGNAQAPLMTLLDAGFSAARSGYLRPFLNGQLRIAVVLAQGHYFVTFKAIHALQVLATALLLVRLARPDSWPRAIGAALGVAALVGAHTFTGAIAEAFPINTYMTIVVCMLLSANLALSEPAWWKDVAAVALLAFAVFTVETGALVMVAIVAARIAGARGVSRVGIAGLCVVIAAYVLARLLGGQLAGPALTERGSAGFGLHVLDATQLREQFADRAWVFYAYNVMCQVLTVLFAEPREGVFRFIDGAMRGTLLPAQRLAVIASTGLTIVMVWFLVTSRDRWKRWALTHDDRVVAVFLAVLGANAVISYPYVKDVIVSAAGALFATAGAVAAGSLLASLASRRWPSAVLLTLLITTLAAAWTVRVVGMEWYLRRSAFVVRREWVDLDAWQRRNRLTLNPQRAALAEQLQRDAIGRRVPPPFFVQPRLERYLLP